ncbi:MAG: hypothetical protein AB7F31_05400 [Parachlamydiales bacterium]
MKRAEHEFHQARFQGLVTLENAKDQHKLGLRSVDDAKDLIEQASAKRVEAEQALFQAGALYFSGVALLLVGLSIAAFDYSKGNPIFQKRSLAPLLVGTLLICGGIYRIWQVKGLQDRTSELIQEARKGDQDADTHLNDSEWLAQQSELLLEAARQKQEELDNLRQPIKPQEQED